MALPVESHTVVLATKLIYPRLPAALVARDRLVAALHQALSHRLTLVAASAGWGKTTLLSAWAHSVTHAVAWLSLDELDNDPKRFWAAFISALRARTPEVGALALAMLHSPERPSLTAVLTALLNTIPTEDQSPPLVLVIDDFHVITDEAIHESLTFLLEHLPPHLHVVLATRVDPDLPLARWRARGALLEIRAADLRFTHAEAHSFFAQTLGDTLAEDDVQRLEQRTEGWVTGLQLATLVLRQHAHPSTFVHTFAGTHRYVLDYVQAEILARQEPHVQRFLIQSAVLRRMNAALCAAVTNEPHSQTMLEALERSNLFVVPLDDERQWYRMHDLFREVLLARLQATAPALIPQFGD
jgi:LuxR family maltose regulon positive regulatory protein